MASFDIIVPCYNYGRYLRECVESVLTQEGVSVRVLVINDASPDDTRDVAEALARQDPRVQVIHHAQNQGHIATYNEGLAQATADYLLLLSADDHLLPGALARAAALMDAEPGVSFCFGHAFEQTSPAGGAPVRERTTIDLAGTAVAGGGTGVISGAEFIALCCRAGASNIVPTPTAIVRTRCQHAVGGYRPSLPHAGDLEMWLRLAHVGAAGFVDTPQAVYRRHAANMSSGYFAEHGLADLRQRLAAIDSFVVDCARGGAPTAHAGALRAALAESAVGFASRAFNANRMDRMEEILHFACEIDPAVTLSRPWRRLALKRRAGYRLARLIQPAQAWLRGASGGAA